MPTAAQLRSAANARERRSDRSAIRALDSPRELARAARIVRHALARSQLTLADLVDDATEPDGEAR